MFERTWGFKSPLAHHGSFVRRPWNGLYVPIVKPPGASSETPGGFFVPKVGRPGGTFDAPGASRASSGHGKTPAGLLWGRLPRGSGCVHVVPWRRLWGQAVSRLSGGNPPGGVYAGPNSSARVNPAVRSRRRARLTGAEDSGVTPTCSWSHAMIFRVFVAATITARETICAANRRQGRVGRLVRIARGLSVAVAVWHDLVHGLVEPGERRGTC